MGLQVTLTSHTVVTENTTWKHGHKRTSITALFNTVQKHNKNLVPVSVGITRYHLQIAVLGFLRTFIQNKREFPLDGASSKIRYQKLSWPIENCHSRQFVKSFDKSQVLDGKIGFYFSRDVPVNSIQMFTLAVF